MQATELEIYTSAASLLEHASSDLGVVGRTKNFPTAACRGLASHKYYSFLENISIDLPEKHPFRLIFGPLGDSGETFCTFSCYFGADFTGRTTPTVFSFVSNREQIAKAYSSLGDWLSLCKSYCVPWDGIPRIFNDLSTAYKPSMEDNFDILVSRCEVFLGRQFESYFQSIVDAIIDFPKTGRPLLLVVPSSPANIAIDIINVILRIAPRSLQYQMSGCTHVISNSDFVKGAWIAVTYPDTEFYSTSQGRHDPKKPSIIEFAKGVSVNADTLTYGKLVAKKIRDQEYVNRLQNEWECGFHVNNKQDFSAYIEYRNQLIGVKNSSDLLTLLSNSDAPIDRLPDQAQRRIEEQLRRILDAHFKIEQDIRHFDALLDEKSSKSQGNFQITRIFTDYLVNRLAGDRSLLIGILSNNSIDSRISRIAYAYTVDKQLNLPAIICDLSDEGEIGENLANAFFKAIADEKYSIRQLLGLQQRALKQTIMRATKQQLLQKCNKAAITRLLDESRPDFFSAWEQIPRVAAYATVHHVFLASACSLRDNVFVEEVFRKIAEDDILRDLLKGEIGNMARGSRHADLVKRILAECIPDAKDATERSLQIERKAYRLPFQSIPHLSRGSEPLENEQSSRRLIYSAMALIAFGLACLLCRSTVSTVDLPITIAMIATTIIFVISHVFLDFWSPFTTSNTRTRQLSRNVIGYIYSLLLGFILFVSITLLLLHFEAAFIIDLSPIKSLLEPRK
jgi:hypothetical protein